MIRPTLDKLHYIDPRIEYRGVSYMRQLSSKTLEKLKAPLVIRDNDKPVVVIVPYDLYIQLQEAAGVRSPLG